MADRANQMGTLRARLVNWFFNAQPRERHRIGLGGSRSAIIAFVCVGTGLLASVKGEWYGPLLILTGIGIAREAHLRYRAGNWP